MGGGGVPLEPQKQAVRILLECFLVQNVNLFRIIRFLLTAQVQSHLLTRPTCKSGNDLYVDMVDSNSWGNLRLLSGWKEWGIICTEKWYEQPVSQSLRMTAYSEWKKVVPGMPQFEVTSWVDWSLDGPTLVATQDREATFTFHLYSFVLKHSTQVGNLSVLVILCDWRSHSSFVISHLSLIIESDGGSSLSQQNLGSKLITLRTNASFCSVTGFYL